ncbi:MAG: AAA family ATPase [Hormoscilla sp. GM7CHS1pb]|nr:AAA family ATPase [Hormoscilla sp. GM7CHS1pb]
MFNLPKVISKFFHFCRRNASFFSVLNQYLNLPGCNNNHAQSLHLHEAWNVKSTSRAKDGLYSYDTVGRLRDAQFANVNRLSDEKLQAIDRPDTYVRWGPLGRAFHNDRRTVLLIDEIDKADIDFPNDLLLELDEQRFEVEETRIKVQAKAAQIMIITSNNEKNLSDAFLRRCLFHYIEFPKRQQLIEIIKSHFPASPAALVDGIIDRFLALREEMQKDKKDAGKKVSTSELMDWFRVLRHYLEDEVLSKLAKELLYPGVLLKN